MTTHQTTPRTMADHLSAHERLFDTYATWSAGFDADDLATQSLCPDWTVRGVVVHLGAVEHMLVGEPPGSMPDALPFGKVGEWMQMVEPLTNAELLAQYRDQRRQVDIDIGFVQYAGGAHSHERAPVPC